MAITSAIVLFVVIWTLVFFMINPLWQTSQSEDGEVVPGTPESAPVDPMVRRKALIALLIAAPLFVLAYLAIVRGWLTLDDISFVRLPSER